MSNVIIVLVNGNADVIIHTNMKHAMEKLSLSAFHPIACTPSTALVALLGTVQIIKPEDEIEDPNNVLEPLIKQLVKEHEIKSIDRPYTGRKLYDFCDQVERAYQERVCVEWNSPSNINNLQVTWTTIVFTVLPLALFPFSYYRDRTIDATKKMDVTIITTPLISIEKDKSEIGSIKKDTTNVKINSFNDFWKQFVAKK